MTDHCLVIRAARHDDLPAIVRMLADDELGRTREQVDGAGDEVAEPYRAAFEAIDADARQLLLVGEVSGVVVATCQVSFLPGLSLRGAWRAQIEAVRVSSAYRGEGVGHTLIGWVIDEARRRGVRVVQLTTDKRRTDAHRFYASLGFRPTHEGFKLPL